MHISFRNYVIIGVGTGIAIFLISTFAGPSLIGFIQGIQADALATGFGGIADIITQPLILILQNPLVGAVIGGIFWPIIALLVLLLFVLMILSLLSGGANQARSTIPGN